MPTPRRPLALALLSAAALAVGGLAVIGARWLSGGRIPAPRGTWRPLPHQ